jgi:hypothetical protein
MPLVTANQYDLVPQFSNIGRGFAQGAQIGSQFKQQKLQQESLDAGKAKQDRINQFTPEALKGDREAITEIAKDDAGLAASLQKIFSSQSQADTDEMLRENGVLTQTALSAKSLPLEQRRPFLMQKREEFKANGRDTSNIDRALSGDDASMNQAIDLQAMQGLKIDEQAKLMFPAAAGEDDPSNVREYKFYQSLTPKQQKQFLTMKRADPTFKMGDVTMLGDQTTGTASPFAEEAGKSQSDIQQTLTDQSAVKAATEKAATSAIAKSEEAFTKIAPIKQGIANYSEVERLIDEGAETGVIASRLPSMKQASIELDNLQGKLGLDVIGNTTFGALSESELKFALATALPKNLEGPALKDWVQRKKSAQEKLLAYTEQAATYLGTPGNTIAGWVETQKQQNKASNIEDLVNKYAN